ncbi:MAG TPA: hypothetical protein VJ835_12050 [Fimbriimonadaceae bacterium]|nr:hypothetical protein [Fimbriimonadaceae bacterium]
MAGAVIIIVMRYMSFLACAALLVGCATQSAPPEQAIHLEKGTKVNLILAKQLNAGEANEGEYVPFLVSEDVMSGGKVAIPKGSVVAGNVTWSRSEGTLSGLVNKPARLEVQIEKLNLGNRNIKMAADLEHPEEPYEFNRENTGKPTADDAKVDELLKDELNRRFAEKLDELFQGKSPELSGTEAQDTLKKIAGEMGMTDTTRLLDQGKSDVTAIGSTIERLQRGDLSGLATGDLSLSLGAVMELANLVGRLGDRFSRALKGRTIRAYPGTKVEAYVAESIDLGA